MAEALWETVTVLVPAFSRFTVTPGAIVTLRESVEMGVAGEPFT